MNLFVKIFIACTLAGVLAACQTTPQRFASMSEEELFAYNAEQPLLKQVICVKEQTTSSYIRKRSCQSIQQIMNERASAGSMLDVLNWGVNYNAGISRRAE